MHTTLKFVTPLLAAVAIASAPAAAAAPGSGQTGGTAGTPTSSGTSSSQQCSSLGGTQTECQSPGNAQVYDAPPQVDFFPYAGGGT
jgi:hypothetical protein